MEIPRPTGCIDTVRLTRYYRQARQVINNQTERENLDFLTADITIMAIRKILK